MSVVFLHCGHKEWQKSREKKKDSDRSGENSWCNSGELE